MPRCQAQVTRGSYKGSRPGRCTLEALKGSEYCARHVKKRETLTDDEALGIRTSRELGIVRRWSCGCAEMAGGLEQPALTCDGGDEHKRRVVQGRAMGSQGSLFPEEGDDDR